MPYNSAVQKSHGAGHWCTSCFNFCFNSKKSPATCILTVQIRRIMNFVLKILLSPTTNVWRSTQIGLDFRFSQKGITNYTWVKFSYQRLNRMIFLSTNINFLRWRCSEKILKKMKVILLQSKAHEHPKTTWEKSLGHLFVMRDF